MSFPKIDRAESAILDPGPDLCFELLKLQNPDVEILDPCTVLYTCRTPGPLRSELRVEDRPGLTA
jgi:hypothetical protein